MLVSNLILPALPGFQIETGIFLLIENLQFSFLLDENFAKQGCGLGLLIASEIAKAHDGSIKAKSTEEEETSFIFSIQC